MSRTETDRRPYERWQKAVLIGCVLVALLGTVAVVGGMVKVSGTIKDYGGSLGAPFFVALLIGLLAVWLFAGSAAVLIHVAKTNGEISEMLRAGRTTPAD